MTKIIRGITAIAAAVLVTALTAGCSNNRSVIADLDSNADGGGKLRKVFPTIHKGLKIGLPLKYLCMTVASRAGM